MTRLTHEQARRYLSAAADKCLNPQDRIMLEAHLAECAACSAYAAEVHWLDGVLSQALKNRWTASRRSPSDLVARVRRRIRIQASQRFVIGFANTLVKLGSLAVVAALAVSLTQHQRVDLASTQLSTPANTSLAASYSRLPSFEFEVESALAATPLINLNDAEHQLQTPPLTHSQFRVMHY